MARVSPSPASRRPGVPPDAAAPDTGALPAVSPAPANDPRGLALGFTAYFLWGLLPLYMARLAPAGAVEIVVVRVGFALLFCLVLLALMRRLRELRAALGTPGRWGATALAAGFIGTNWLLYAVSVTTGNVLQASLGYFMNPLVNVLLGVLFLGERLRRGQWAAVGIAVAAVVVMSAAMGQVPWIALGLAFSFGLYGFVKKRFPTPVHAVTTMTAETVVLLPAFAVGMVWLGQAGLLTTFTEGPAHFWLMAGLGVLTAVPLILFSAAAKALTLTTLGMLQYTAPILQFIVAVTVLGEHMPAARWAGFGLIWLSLVVFTLDQVRASRLHRRAARAGHGARA
ncbi:EamA family transporter RarD [Micrococcus sp. HG099]|uniref:EamA family transporter RarD n=1 Tax=Micrococcus sp. HG099 TaxID=2969755 RepID=UPI00215A128B|nr:EamA family transporter RarD [Micrococcus sp. HG099]MCR8675407.1 EamA family transporter RarD [Micrococcus sp. HG099]